MGYKTRLQFGHDLSRLVDSRDIKPWRFCSMVGCTSETWRRWLVGGAYPSVTMLYKMRDVLKCRWVDLLGPDD